MSLAAAFFLHASFDNGELCWKRMVAKILPSQAHAAEAQKVIDACLPAIAMISSCQQ